MWTYADAIALALDEARVTPGIDTDKLATQLWAEMEAENFSYEPTGGYAAYCIG